MKKNVVISALIVMVLLTMNKINDNRIDILRAKNKITDLMVKNRNSETKLRLANKYFYEVINQNHYSLTATAYTFSADECDSTPWQAAYGKSSYDGIAVSQDLIKSGDFCPGDLVLITSGKNVMTRYVMDTMNERFTNRIDIPSKSKWWAKNFWGKRQVQVINLTGVRRAAGNDKKSELAGSEYGMPILSEYVSCKGQGKGNKESRRVAVVESHNKLLL